MNMSKLTAAHLSSGKWIAILLGVALNSACDLSVTNPGPVQDTFLNERPAHEAIANGAGRDLADGLKFIAYTGAAITRELHPAGSHSAHGISPRQQIGILDEDDTTAGNPWNLAQRARWVAEDGTRRFREELEGQFTSYEPAARILLWAGFANRLLGENMCEAVIDGGEAQPSRVYHERAEGHFTEAIQIASNIESAEIVAAARAGRAATRVGLGDWPGAVADAREVPEGVAFAMPYFDLDDTQYNRIFWAGANQPYRAHTVWNTKYEEYYEETGDTRTPWLFDPELPEGDAAVGDLGRVPFYRQMKFDDRTSAINLASEREMRLILSEALLRDGSWEEAMNLINDLRTEVGVELRDASGAEEAWTHLKAERGIELWLEGRRLGDFRRWDAESTPGDLHRLEVEGGAYPLSPDRSLCWPIPLSERETNPNIPLS